MDRSGLAQLSVARWRKGPANHDRRRGLIRLDGAQATDYYPISAGDDLLFDLAAVREPQDAVAFARRFGLLTRAAAPWEEPWAPWETTSKMLSAALEVVHLARQAQPPRSDGDALAYLWANWEPHIRSVLDAAPADSDAELLRRASIFVEGITSVGLAGTQLAVTALAGVEDDEGPLGPPGVFGFNPHPPDLRGYAFYVLATHIVERRPLSQCEECHRFFTPDDRRQRFCTTTCANRARRRRWRERKGDISG